MDKNAPEILEMLLEDQEAYDWPSIVCRIFHQKILALINNFKNGKYFGSKCVYIVHVIEFQHRGLPHAHIVIRLQNGPNHDDIAECKAFIDKYINTTLPGMDDPLYQSLVSSKLLHRCSYGINGCLNEHDVCKKKFKKGIVPETFFVTFQSISALMIETGMLLQITEI